MSNLVDCPEVKVVLLDHAIDLPLPTYCSVGSSGADLCAAVLCDIELKPFDTALIPTGLIICLSDGLEGQVRSRSGLALNHGIVVLNSPGTIDSDYRGELKVIIKNFGNQTFVIKRGMRIAQLVIVSGVVKVNFVVQHTVESTKRDSSGFGSTGLYAFEENNE